MKVALIGADGQLGSDLVRTAPKEVELKSLTLADFNVIDHRKMKEVLVGLKPDVILNTAAYVNVDGSEDDPETCFAVNAVAVASLANIANELGSTVVHISTDYVFDGTIKDRPYVEGDLANPLSVYGASKYAGELNLRNRLNSHYVFRLASLFGRAGAWGKGGNFITAILKKARSKEPLRVISDMMMSPTYSMDASKEIWRAVQDRREFGLYHATNCGVCSWYEFAKRILEIANVRRDIGPISHKDFPTKARRPLWSPLASTKGIALRSWQEALEEYFRSDQPK
jgi:dTDP-4-dehydrorhamnose reductase